MPFIRRQKMLSYDAGGCRSYKSWLFLHKYSMACAQVLSLSRPLTGEGPAS